MNIEELEDNAYRTILKAISFTLSNSEKYNGVENILIKTKKSIPFNIFGNINAENINNYRLLPNFSVAHTAQKTVYNSWIIALLFLLTKTGL